MLTPPIFIQLLLNGFALGMVYSLMASGMSLMFGVAKVLNLAHGLMYMVAGYGVLIAVSYFGLPAYIAVIPAIGIALLLGMGVHRFVVVPAKYDAQAVLISTFAVATIGEQFAILIWGGYNRGVPPLILGSLSIYGIYITTQKAIACLVAIGVVATLMIFLQRTRTGKAIRMVSEDRDMAEVVGINTNRISMLTFGIGSSLAGIAGALLTPVYTVAPNIGWTPLLIAFVIIILGGMGRIRGTIIAGFIYGTATSFLEFFIPKYSLIVLLIIVSIALIIRPTGILSSR